MELNETFESQINRSDYKILIVDDVVSNVLLLKILLTNEKFQVCTGSARTWTTRVLTHASNRSLC